MRFTILARPGSDPGELRASASALVAADDPESVAAAARASADAYVLLLARGARVRAGATRALRAVSAADERFGVLGGVENDGRTRRFGWMLAPAHAAPLPFELAPIATASGDTSNDPALRGPIDVAAPGMLLVARELLLEPLPHDALAAVVELCARARAAGRTVACDPALACDLAAPALDDRGRAAAWRSDIPSSPARTVCRPVCAGARSTARSACRAAAASALARRCRASQSSFTAAAPSSRRAARATSRRAPRRAPPATVPATMRPAPPQTRCARRCACAATAIS
jgi:hypothetical protein